MFLTILLLIIGLVILIGGAESLIRGASSISKKAGIPPIVIGLTIVAFGTSAPELIVNIFSALKVHIESTMSESLTKWPTLPALGSAESGAALSADRVQLVNEDY